jgi:hypothetical protein
VVTNALVGPGGDDSVVVGVLGADATLRVVDAASGNTLAVSCCCDYDLALPGHLL